MFLWVGLAGLACLFLLSSAKTSASPTWSTRVWQIDDGLLDNNVISVVQGPGDYLWLATPIGLMRFDGDSFSQFPLENLTGAASHVRVMLYSRSTGALWMGSDGGTVTELKPDFSMTLFQRNLPVHIPHLAEGADGSLWLGYPNDVYRLQNGKPTAIKGLPLGLFHSLISDGAGNIWLAKGDQIGVFRNGTFCKIATMPGAQQMAATHTNAVWVATSTRLFTCGIDGVIRDFGSFQDSHIPATRVLLQDHTGGVWIGTSGDGLFYYHNSMFERIKTSASSIMSLAEDREGNIWAGTSGGGLDRISLSGVRLEVIEDNQTPSQIQSICQDTNGVLWGAARNGDLVSQMGDRWKLAFTNAPFAGTVTCLAADRTAVWLGTWNGKLFRLVSTNYTVWETNLSHGRIIGLLSASNGDLWMVGEHTLQCLHGRQLENIKLPRRAQNIYAIAEDAAGNIWIGANGILVRFSGENHTNEIWRPHMLERPICCLYGTADGSLWIGSRGGGLVRFKNGHFSQIGVKQGLCDNYISQMIADGHGWIWFAANHGIFKIRQQELEQAMEDRNVVLHPIVYGKNEGLASQEAISSATDPSIFPCPILSSDGHIWMLVHDGVVVGDPKILPENSPPLPALLTEVIVDGQTIASYDGVAESQTFAKLQELKVPLRLLPSHRHLEFDFTAIHLTDPENVCFRYQLVGFDNGWIDAGLEHSATYSRLSAGSYQFLVEACAEDGPWDQTPTTVAFTVAPFFWKTWWFQLGILFLFTSTGIVIFRYISTRRMRTQLHLLEQRATLDRERTRIARDLHDDLGCSLNKVALTLDMMQSDSAGSDSGGAEIRRCSLMVRDIAQSMDEIVWAINPRNDTLCYMVDYISQSAVEFLQAAGLRRAVDLPENLPDRTVPPEVRHNLLLVVKEALNNIARHAHATEVQLRIAVSQNQIVIEIKDNGCGFQCEPDNSACDGLRNMRQRMKEIHGEFQLKSQPGAGTHVAFHYRWRG